MNILDLVGTAATRTEATIARLSTRLADEQAAVSVAEAGYRGELLAREEGESDDRSDAKALAVTSAKVAAATTEATLTAARDRLAALRSNDERAASLATRSARADVRKRMARLVHDRGVAATSMRVALQRFAQDRATFDTHNVELAGMARTLGIELDVLGCALDRGGFEIHLAHELAELRIAGRAAWSDPTGAPRPTLAGLVEQGNAVILAAIGTDRG